VTNGRDGVRIPLVGDLFASGMAQDRGYRRPRQPDSYSNFYATRHLCRWSG